MTNSKRAILLTVLFAIALIMMVAGITYAFFNYTRIGSVNTVSTSTIEFNFTDDTLLDINNDFPQDVDMSNQELVALKSTHTGSLNLSGHNTLTNGVKYRIYVVHGDDMTGKQRLADSSIKFQLEPDFTSGTDGFTVLSNYYDEPTNLSFDNEGKALISTGLVKDTTQLTTVSYNFYMWLDAGTMHISSTMKRATLAEGNPSLADTTTGNTTAGRYMKNDGILTTETLFPASSSQEGKIIYTTNEFSNGYYNIKFLVEAEDANGKSIVYLNANGGLVASSVISVTPGEEYPELPTPTRSGYTFLGWNGKNKFNKENYLLLSDYSTGDIPSYSIAPISLKSNTTYHFSVIRKNNFDGTGNGYLLLDDTTQGNTHWSAIAHPSQPNQCHYSGCTYTTGTNGLLYVSRTGVQQSNLDTIWDNTDIQIEEGLEATDYEPYYVDDTVIVTQTNDHVLTAIWQKNS